MRRPFESSRRAASILEPASAATAAGGNDRPADRVLIPLPDRSLPRDASLSRYERPREGRGAGVTPPRPRVGSAAVPSFRHSPGPCPAAGCEEGFVLVRGHVYVPPRGRLAVRLGGHGGHRGVPKRGRRYRTSTQDGPGVPVHALRPAQLHRRRPPVCTGPRGPRGPRPAPPAPGGVP